MCAELSMLRTGTEEPGVSAPVLVFEHLSEVHEVGRSKEGGLYFHFLIFL